jgi:hypothetical protein
VNRVSGSADNPEYHAAQRRFRDARERKPAQQHGRQLEEHDQHCHQDRREQAQGDAREQLPVLELVLRHLVGVQEHRADDGEVDTERDARRNNRPEEGLDEPLPAGPGDLQDQHHHDHRAGEQPAERAGEAGQRGQLGVFLAEPSSLGQPAAGPAADVGESLLRAEAGASEQRHRRHQHGPRDQPRIDMLLLQVRDQAGKFLG